MSMTSDRLDEAALRSNKLDLLERVAGGLGHEIKNPLHSMVINLEVLKRKVAARKEGGDAPELVRYLDVLGDEIERVSRRLELILQLAGPGPGGASLDETVKKVAELLELEAERCGVTTSFDAGVPSAGAAADTGEFRQLVMNLWLVALDRASPGGSVRVATRAVRGGYELEVLAGPSSTPPPSPSDTRLEAAAALAERAGARLQTSDDGLRFTLGFSNTLPSLDGEGG